MAGQRTTTASALSTPSTPPSLLESISASTADWQRDLERLFHNAGDRFPDVVWELQPDEPVYAPDGAPEYEEVWGHKAIVYARAPPSFQARYFSFRPAPVSSPTPLPQGAYFPNEPLTLPDSSALSLSLPPLAIDFGSTSPSPGSHPSGSASHLAPTSSHLPRSHSPAPSNRTGRTTATTATAVGTLTRFPTTISPALFANELEYLYTGKGLGAAFEFLFEDSGSRPAPEDEEEARVDKLRKDLVYMWRSRLYSDVRIALTGSFSSTNHETSIAIFSSHRFMLVSRSPYFYAQLLKWDVNAALAARSDPRISRGLGDSLPSQPSKEDADKDLPTVTLPSPPFTPASLHFTLGYLYTGTLVFSHRTYDLDTALALLQSAMYIQLDSLHDEAQARIVQEMMHGLFHAFLDFGEYERVTGGKWGVGGCRCRQCARRAPRILEFAVRDDVKNVHLERGARRALVGLFGDGWCTSEFAELPQKTRDGVLKGLAKRTTPANAFALLWAAHTALAKIENTSGRERWAELVKDMVLSARGVIDACLANESEKCFEEPDWLEIMDADGARFDDPERVDYLTDAIRRGLNESNAGTIYQTLVSAVLLRTNDQGEPLLSSTSHVRVQVEELRMDILRWLRKRWLGVRQRGGFDGLEGWAVKEISGEIDIPVDDLYNPEGQVPIKPGTSETPRSPAHDGDSMHSIPQSVTSRDPPQTRLGVGKAPRAPSVRSLAASTKSRTTLSTPVRRSVASSLASPGSRPDSKLTPASASLRASSISTRSSATGSMKSATEGRRSTAASPTNARTTSGPRSTSKATGAAALRASSASVTSVRSHASTVRMSKASAGLKPPSTSISRPSSTMSMTSEGSTTFKTAKSELNSNTSNIGAPEKSTPTRRRLSTSSAASAASRAGRPSPSTTTPRRTSAMSTASATSSVRSPRKSGTGQTDATKLAPAKRPTSQASVRSTASKATTRKPLERKTPVDGPQPSRAGGTIKVRPKKIETGPPSPPARSETGETAASGSTLTVRTARPERLKHKTSNETIKDLAQATATYNPLGATLDIGIPCIITSRRARFRALARYIGEVVGETGPWVGVEVPVGDSWPPEKLEGRQWHDGTWGGVRYFDLGTSSEWDEHSTTSSRRMGGMSKSLKREGTELGGGMAKRFRSESPAISDVSMHESRGLFVRPSQVLYVVDAVGTDL